MYQDLNRPIVKDVADHLAHRVKPRFVKQFTQRVKALVVNSRFDFVMQGFSFVDFLSGHMYPFTYAKVRICKRVASQACHKWGQILFEIHNRPTSEDKHFCAQKYILLMPQDRHRSLPRRGFKVMNSSNGGALNLIKEATNLIPLASSLSCEP